MAILFSGRSDIPGPEHFVCSDTVKDHTGRVFEIGDRIQAGGNGVVHRCKDAASGYDYAIKFQLDLRKNRLRRFLREQTLLSELKHDHLMIYEGHGDCAGKKVRRFGPRKTLETRVTIPFVVMHLARCNLFESVREESIRREIYIAQFRGLAQALGALHEKAVHRDIKPENILVIGERWVISDYGLCDLHNTSPRDRLTPDWEVVGPKYWMSPEANNRCVGRRDAINAASDVFQLASVFWFVVNRSHPTGVLSKSDWSGPDALFEPIFKALHYDSAVRPADGKAFATMIDAAVLS